MARLDPSTIDALIGTSSFHEAKARQIHEIARRTVTEFDGKLPCDFEVLTSFKGVGPKCANLALGIACGQSRIGVDIDRKSTRLNSSHANISYAVFCLKKKNKNNHQRLLAANHHHARHTYTCP